MRVYFDTEFTGLRQDTTLISVGCVAETGETFYGECTDYDGAQVNDWIQDNVIAHLELDPRSHKLDGDAWCICHNSAMVAGALASWLKQVDAPVEMWADCLAYDWVLFCQMYGGAFKIPSSVYYIPFDLSTLLKIKGEDPDVNREEFAGMTDGVSKHNALWDALVVKRCYEKLMA